ncbi:Berberine bridge enzyme-like [Thalictrum thalictroides]|uniref:Berberine bridge enzyme-like n=1 Tax=Thalictrum thalictroides TaxID=46969 RepID=A0A7J6W7X0_THATH|nr:Berberine bridge enzyme-like [Thalictrum thalictroides]
MKTSSIALLVLFHTILSLASSFATPGSIHENFLLCLSLHSDPSIPIYSPNSSSYSSILQFSVRNLRFSTPTTPKPELIITALHESHVQAAVICSRKYGLQLRIRSGGHDYEGLSYASDVPFVIVDLLNLQSISVDAKKGTAWVQAGATIGQLYHNIAVKSRTYGFPAGICPTVGVGGHFSGGGYGALLRKYGLAADNIVDARLVNVDGKILDRKSMGEDLFWAIRGGGGASFGVVLSYKINLVRVPPIVTVFTFNKNLEEGATALVERWQYVADKLPQDLFIRIVISVANSTQRPEERTVQASFQALFLGGVDKLIPIMEQRFPELGLTRKNCTEMSWIQSVLYFAGFPINGSSEVLVDRTPLNPLDYFKAKSDYVTEPISETGLEGIWKMLLEENRPEVIFSPYGGRMNEISESAIPFPHRVGNIYKIQHLVFWQEKGLKASKEHIAWIRRLYRYLIPYVSKFPRSAYLNYRDLDLGQSKNGTASYSEAKEWGIKYFKNNFDRLVKVKSKVDPDNFFRNEQSIPTIPWGKKK